MRKLAEILRKCYEIHQTKTIILTLIFLKIIFIRAHIYILQPTAGFEIH